MPSRSSSLSDLLNSLDAPTYFFVSSGIFIAVTAVLFFVFGLWLGALLWGRYKRRFRNSEDVIEAFKGEVALLKRRIAEQSTRPSPGMGPSPLQSIAFKSAPPKPTASIIGHGPALAPPSIREFPAPVGRSFTVWTEPGWSPVKTKQRKLPDARILNESADSPAKAAKPEASVTSASMPSSALPAQPLFSPLEVFMAPRSRAFCIWTEKTWTAPLVKTVPMPPAAGFALWTQHDFQPSCRGPSQASRAHTLWTSPEWTPTLRPGPPARSARAFTVWTEPGWKPMLYVHRSRAFSVWTDADWSPPRITRKRLPPGAAWSVWTSPSFVPACRGALPSSRAYSLWTDEGWTPAAIAPQPCFVGKPFSVWTESPRVFSAVAAAPAPQAAVVPATPATLTSATEPTAALPRKSQGFVARTLAAVKQALGLSEAHAIVPPSGADKPAEVTADAPVRSGPPATGIERPGSPVAVSEATATPPADASRESSSTTTCTGESPDVAVTRSPTPTAIAVSLAATAAAVEALRQSGPPARVMSPPVVPAIGGPMPPSKAFTVWTGGPAFESAENVTQRVTLAALVESKITANTPMPSQAPVAPPSTVPPVPVVPSSKAAVAAPVPTIPQLPLLDLEPLRFPAEAPKT